MNLYFKIGQRSSAWGVTTPEGLSPDPATNRTLATLACHNAFGGGSSRSDTTSNDNRVGASGTATVTQGQGVTSGSGSIAVGSGGRYAEAGATDIMGGNGGVQITTADPEVLKTALETLTGFVTQANQTAANATTAQGENLNTVLAAISKLSEVKQTEGISSQQKVFIIIGLGLLGVIGLAAYKK